MEWDARRPESEIMQTWWNEGVRHPMKYGYKMWIFFTKAEKDEFSHFFRFSFIYLFHSIFLLLVQNFIHALRFLVTALFITTFV